MVGAPVFTHQLGRVADEVRPFIFEQHSFLKDIDASEVHDEVSARTFMKKVEKVHGATIVLRHEPGKFRVINPASELEAMLRRTE